MRGGLICPGERAGISFLGASCPLVNIPILGDSLASYWLRRVAALGWKEAVILATDRPDQVREELGDGARWGLRVEVCAQMKELSLEEALALFPEMCAAERMDHFPTMPERKILSSYAAWFDGILAWWPRAAKMDRIGFREVAPGIWTGLRVQVSAGAHLRPPCWLGHHVVVERDAVIGPEAVLEDGVLVDAAAEISQSVVGKDTFVGSLTRLRQSLAWGNLLVNWRTGSCTLVPDAFLLCPLAEHSPRRRFGRWLQKIGSGLADFPHPALQSVGSPRD